ncbi:MAG TPA: TonB-dependent receptor plug domain-containing protein, partial [Duganella sp.]|nr:TonB-dependent receptor plug domain-containing protein [Duganella sp.]
MRIKGMVLALAGVTAAWAVQAEEVAPIEQVVIAGDKLKRTETDSSASVGARNRRQIAESGLTSLDEVAGQMANVGTAENLSIRGVQAYGPTGGGGKTITLVVDGVPQDGFGQEIGNLSVWDADRVEVLRGPQSTNQGRNSLAGAVVLKTRDPSDTRDFSYRVSAGNQNAHRVAMAGGGAIVEQVLAGRISLEQRKRDGDVYNPTRDDKRSNHDDGHTLRAKLRV